MHEDNSGFGVWNRVDASIELCVAVGYPLFSVLCHVRVRSKAVRMRSKARSKAVPSLGPSRIGHEHLTCDLLSKIRIYRDCNISIISLNKKLNLCSRTLETRSQGELQLPGHKTSSSVARLSLQVALLSEETCEGQVRAML